MLCKFIKPVTVITLALLSFSPILQADNHPVTLDEILSQKEEPAGVIIEIVTGKSNGLDWALPRAQQYIGKLKKRFPEMPVAIVTHGREQFALAKDKQKKNSKVHTLTQALKKDGVNLHVCGTYAGWKGLSEEDFPEYVNVAAEGPAQINDYKAVGFLHLVIKNKD